MQRQRLAIALCVLSFLVTACGGGGSTPAPPTAPPVPFQHLYVSDDANNLYVYNYPVSASSTPSVTLSGTFEAGLAVQGNQLYAAHGAQVQVFTLPLSASSTPSRTITLTSSALDIAVDSSGRLFAAENVSNVCCVDVVNPGGSSPAYTLKNANVVTPFGLTIDAAQNLFLANSGSVGYFAAPVTSASAGISFGRDGFNEGIAADSHDNLYVADGNGPGTLDIYNPPYSVSSSLVASTTLGGTLEQMAMASNDVLYVAAGGTLSQVDVVVAPYASVSFAIAVPTKPYGIAVGN